MATKTDNYDDDFDGDFDNEYDFHCRWLDDREDLRQKPYRRSTRCKLDRRLEIKRLREEFGISDSDAFRLFG